jgi:hypothetical protein
MKAHTFTGDRKQVFLFEPDRFLQRYYFPTIALLVLFTSVHYLRVAYLQAMDWSGWSIGEWLINLEAGWVRRGLGGQIVLLLSDATSIPMNWMALVIQVLSYLVFVGLFLTILRKKAITFWYFVACFAPGFLLFTYYDSMAVGRKEVLLYLAFAVWLWICLYVRQATVITLCFSLVCLVLTLIHETFFFYTPYFVIVGLLSNNARMNSRWQAWLIPSFSFLGALITVFLFEPINGAVVCNSLLARGAAEVVCSGIITFGAPNASILLGQYISHFDKTTWFAVFQVFAVIIISGGIVLRGLILPGRSNLPYAFGLLLLVFFSAPLFMLATDWGRWISMHVTLLTCAGVMLLKERENPKSLLNHTANYASTPRPCFKTYLIAMALFALVNMTYSLQHCCDKTIIVLFGPFKKIENTRLFSVVSDVSQQ